MKFLIFLLLVFIFPIFVNAQVLINEIAWMGNESSANKEWIELWNNSGENVNLNAWNLYSKDNALNISLSGIIAPKEFFILERTDDQTLPNIQADLVYKGALGNNGEYLILKDNNGNIIDKIDASEGWFSGDKSTKQTMQLIINSLNNNNEVLEKIWITAIATPKAKNQESIINAQKNLNKEDEQINIQQKDNFFKTENKDKNKDIAQNSYVIEKSVEYQNVNVNYDILISEFMPNPEGSDETEWIEIFNKGDNVANLGGFILDDKQGGLNEYIIPLGTNILPQTFLVFKRQDTKIALNNTDDMVRLLYPSGEVLAQISYDKALENHSASLNIKDNKFYWTEDITKGKTNNEINNQKITIKSGENKQNISEVALNKADNNLTSNARALKINTATNKDAIIWSIIIGIIIGILGVLGYQKWILYD